MNILTACPCCSNPMLHCIGNHREYWFCRNCWQEMPDLGEVKRSRSIHQSRIVNLSIGLRKLTRPELIST